MLSKVTAALVLTSLVASCGVVGPQYQRPILPLEQRFAFASGPATQPAARDAWWEDLSDPVLNRIMSRALDANLTVEAAVARIAQAQAQVRATGPASQLSGETTLSARARWTDGDYTDTAQAGTAPSFVLDLFGVRQRRHEVARAQLEAAEFDAAAARLAIQLAVAEAYLDLRFAQALENLRQRAIRNQARVVDAARDREALRAESKMAVRRTEAELQLQRALLPAAQQNQRVAVLRLATLLSEPYANVLSDIDQTHGQPTPKANISPGVPAELLKNRPDLRAAEARLRAAVAEVGVNEAQLYPTLRLDGAITLGADSTVALGPTLSIPVLNRTSRLAARDAARAGAKEAEAIWRAEVRASIEEVQLNLSQLQTADQEVAALLRAAATLRDAAGLTREAFRLQATTTLEILDVEDRLTETEIRLITARRSFGQAWARLNVAIGQGWKAASSDIKSGP
ncbi:MAG: efflux transporter outer membrane subunit [Pseudomonadota bacterium]